MKSAKEVFLITYAIFFGIGLVLLFILEHGDLVIFFNENRTSFGDIFFKYWTYLGDGVFLALLLILMLFIRYAYAILFLIIGIAQGITTYVLKKLVFGKIPRPGKYFEGIYDLQLIDGVKMNNYFSFPSGHTMTAFSIAAFLTMISKKKYFGIIWCCYAVLVGLSRVYTLQHFHRDIMVGSIIGITITLVVFAIYKQKLAGNWLNGSLIKTFRKEKKVS